MSRSFDQIAGIYDATRAIPPAAMAAIADGLQRLAGATPATTWLDVGIGTGRIALPLARAGCRYTGVDLSRPMLRGARENAGPDARTLGLVCADARALPFPDASFDVALIVHVLHLIPDWPRALDATLRALRPGGHLLYGFEHSAGEGGIRAFARQWRAILAGHGVTPRNHSATDAPVLAALRERDLAPETHLLATWTTTGRPEGVLAGYAGRAYSSSWAIPDDIFAVAIDALTAWARERFPDPTIAITGEQHFSVTVTRRGQA